MKLRDSFPCDSAFGGVGRMTGPLFMMSDNCSELRDAVSAVWPKTTLLLCVFHLLQQVWRWLNDKKHGVDLKHRNKLLTLFKNILYADSEVGMEVAYEELMDDDDSAVYPNFQRYIDTVYEERDAWAVCYRKDSLLRGSNTNNYVVAQFGVLKDGILQRLKEYNINGLFDTIVDLFNQHYVDKLLSVSNCTFDGVYSRRFAGKEKKKGDGVGFKNPDPLMKEIFFRDYQSLGNDIYIVPSTSIQWKTYLLNMSTGVCSCDTGRDGSPCKHQFLLWSNKISRCCNFLLVFDKHERKKLAFIALGQTMNISYYEGLHDQIEQPQFSEPSQIESIRN